MAQPVQAERAGGADDEVAQRPEAEPQRDQARGVENDSP